MKNVIEHEDNETIILYRIAKALAEGRDLKYYVQREVVKDVDIVYFFDEGFIYVVPVRKDDARILI